MCRKTGVPVSGGAVVAALGLGANGDMHGFVLDQPRLMSLCLFGLALILPLVLGGLAVYRLFPDRGKRAAVAWAAFLGLIVFEASLIGMLLDPKSGSASLQYKLTVAGAAAVGAFLLVLLGTLFYSNVLRMIRK